MNMTKWNKVLLACLITAILSVSVASCGVYHSLFDDKVVTTEDNVKPDVPKDHIVKAPTQGVLSPEQDKKLEESGKGIVIVDKKDVKEPSKAAEITNPNADSALDLLGVGLGVLKVLFPGVIGLEGLGVLLSQRKRMHYADAVKSILPTDGSVDLGEAMLSVAKALGFAHSSEASKQAAKTA